MKTFSLKSSEIDKKWIIIDAEGLVLGRLATFVASRLAGKHKPTFAPHLDMGDNVIVVNARKIALTGRKRAKPHYWHSGYPGGIKSRTTEEILSGKHPERIVIQAVRRMLPGNRLSRQILRNLRVYAGAEHPHEAQSPQVISPKTLDKKASRGKAARP